MCNRRQLIYMLLSFITRLYLSYGRVIAFVLLFANKYTKLPEFNYVHVRALPATPLFLFPVCLPPGATSQTRATVPSFTRLPGDLSISATHTAQSSKTSPPPTTHPLHTPTHTLRAPFCVSGAYLISVSCTH